MWYDVATQEAYMRYFVTFLIGISLVVLVIILLIRAIFGGGDTQTAKAPTLVDYANTNVVMRYTIWSQVEADQAHQQLRIDISKYSSDIYLYNGYENTLIKNQSYPSNPSAYSDFLRGLDLLGYTKGNPDKALADWRGYCPSGQRYVYEIIDGSSTVQQYWATSCSKKSARTFLGQVAPVNGLFRAQIPEYKEFVVDTNF
jgi:hypothetical protein